MLMVFIFFNGSPSFILRETFQRLLVQKMGTWLSNGHGAANICSGCWHGAINPNTGNGQGAIRLIPAVGMALQICSVNGHDLANLENFRKNCSAMPTAGINLIAPCPLPVSGFIAPCQHPLQIFAVPCLFDYQVPIFCTRRRWNVLSKIKDGDPLKKVINHQREFLIWISIDWYQFRPLLIFMRQSL